VSALAEWRSGWRYVFCNDIGQMSLVINTYTTGLMIKPLGAAFGWSRADVSGALAIYAMATFFCAPLAGALIDRYGARRIALIGAPATALVVIGMGLCGPSIWTWRLAWAGFGVFSLMMGSQPWAAAISRHFDVSRGLALAIGASGNGLGALVWPPFTVFLIEHYGWRGAYFGLGTTIGLCLTSCVFLLMRGPAAMPEARAAAGEGAPRSQRSGLTVPQVLRTWSFWQIALGTTAMGMAVASLVIHLPALLTDKGMTPGQAAGVMTLLAPTVIAGRVGGGFLLDRIHGRWVMVAMLLLPAAACLTLVGYHGGYPLAIAATLMIGVTSGVEGDLISFLLSRYFGLRHFAAIYGATLSIFVLGYGFAPTVVGGVFDQLRSYDFGLIGLAVLTLACLPAALTLGRYPYPAGERDP